MCVTYRAESKDNIPDTHKSETTTRKKLTIIFIWVWYHLNDLKSETRLWKTLDKMLKISTLYMLPRIELEQGSYLGKWMANSVCQQEYFKNNCKYNRKWMRG